MLEMKISRIGECSARYDNIERDRIGWVEKWK